MSAERGGASVGAWSRRLRLLQLLIRRGSITTRETAAVNGTSRRTALADLHALETNGVPLSQRGTDRERCWVLQAGWRETGLDLGLEERLAMLFGRQLVSSFLHDTDFGDALARLDVSLAALGAHGGRAELRRRFHYVHELEKGYESQRELLRSLITAILGSQRVTLRYRHARSRQRTQARVAPLTLLIYKRGLYVMAERREVRSLYAVERIESIEVHADQLFDYPRPAEYDPARELSGRFGLSSSDEPVQEVVLRFDALVQSYVAGRRWMEEQTLNTLPDGRVELRFIATGPELVSQVLQYGATVEVVAPEWLRAAVLRDLRGALSHYQRTDVQSRG